MHHSRPQEPNLRAPLPQGWLALEDRSLVSQPADCGASDTQLSVEGSLQAVSNALCHFIVTHKCSIRSGRRTPLRLHLGPRHASSTSSAWGDLQSDTKDRKMKKLLQYAGQELQAFGSSTDIGLFCALGLFCNGQKQHVTLTE